VRRGILLLIKGVRVGMNLVCRLLRSVITFACFGENHGVLSLQVILYGSC
jgi:hypothetical protein